MKCFGLIQHASYNFHSISSKIYAHFLSELLKPPEAMVVIAVLGQFFLSICFIAIDQFCPYDLD